MHLILYGAKPKRVNKRKDRQTNASNSKEKVEEVKKNPFLFFTFTLRLRFFSLSFLGLLKLVISASLSILIHQFFCQCNVFFFIPYPSTSKMPLLFNSFQKFQKNVIVETILILIFIFKFS